MVADPNDSTENGAWNLAQRLAVACAVAPSLRVLNEKAGSRRIARVDASGKVVGYTTLAEVQRALLLTQQIELAVAEGVRPQKVVCRNCGRLIQVKRTGPILPVVCREGCDRTCSTVGCLNEVSVRTARKRAMGLTPGICRSCVGKQLQEAITSGRQRAGRTGKRRPLTQEEKIAFRAKMLASTSPEQRSEVARKREQAKTPEERRAGTRKALEARRAKQLARTGAV